MPQVMTMERRIGSLNVNFREIARELGLSPMTIYRVVNLDPCVSRETRERVTDALNRCGFFTHRRGKRFKVLFDFIDHPYLSHYGEKLLHNIRELGFHCSRTCYRTARTRFLDMAAVSDVAVFISVPDSTIIDEARRVNPDLYTVTLSTRSNADVTLSPDNTRGGELAARHLARHRHRHIAIHLAERHPTRMERCKAFCGEMRFLDPDCRIDFIHERRTEQTAPLLRSYFDSVDRLPDSILFLAGEFADCYRRELLEPEPERYSGIGVLTFDHPLDQRFAHLEYNFDCIGFRSQDLLEWAEYYITNRPMMKKRTPIHTLIEVQLVENGSIRMKS